MSIHQAKGLEFPIVVVPDLNRKAEPSRNGVVFHSMLGPLVRLSSEPVESDEDESTSGGGGALGWNTFQALERVEDDEEAKRLFYVATTRARDALILSAGVGPDAKPASPALRLLAERFNRSTGECRARLPEGWGIPTVRVIKTPPASASHGARHRGTRPDLIGVARLITSTPVQHTAARLEALRRPRLILMDEARRLLPRAARRDRLLRSILADPDLERPAAVDAVARRAGTRQDPVAHPELIEAAVSLLAPWLASTLVPALIAAADVERGFEWTISWPPDSVDSTVIHGRSEFLIRRAPGESELVVVSDPTAPEAWERLRLLLSVRAAALLGFGPVFRAWRVRLGDLGGIETKEDFSDRAIDAAITSALEVRVESYEPETK
jgi:ATP-dependent helicase/nuclease subunit A